MTLLKEKGVDVAERARGTEKRCWRSVGGPEERGEDRRKRHWISVHEVERKERAGKVYCQKVRKEKDRREIKKAGTIYEGKSGS